MTTIRDHFESVRDRILAWHRARRIRRVLVIAATLGILLMLLSMVETKTAYLFSAGATCLIGAVGASIIDTAQTMREFKKTIAQLNKEYATGEMTDARKVFGIEIGLGKKPEPTCFNEADRHQIKTKIRTFRGIIVAKAMLIGMLLYFLIQTNT